ncbi:DUF1513 domain-containing protein [Sulfitobacter donghicola]|nr:DUF1513 domain-containing protein [Sulfitobacter donghicola]KIN68498.1 Twin-arginine translocation pathway signal protein [Sulfitobacter donghicola DSW-25 = KCTC 12864 = JCM 14565]
MVAGLTWADVGAPSFLTAAIDRNNNAWLIGLSGTGDKLFQLPLPSRGHAAAAHPTQPVAVAFARRPGRFAIIVDCTSGQEVARLNAPNGLHFYGHGAFSADGNLLLTTENAYEEGVGRIGVWDVQGGCKRIGELPSGGVGPHEIIRLNNGSFAVANGGILTHPDSGRSKLNLPTMRSNLTYLSAQGAIEAIIEPPEEFRQNSIRHIDANADQSIAIALQWQGDPRKNVPVAALAKPDGSLAFLDHPDTARLKHYGGSVAMSSGGEAFYVTGPKGNWVLTFDVATGAPIAGFEVPLASGVAALDAGVAMTSKSGLSYLEGGQLRSVETGGDMTWDNHLVRLTHL